MITIFILLMLILISYYFVNSKEHLINTNPKGTKITYEGDAIRYTCGDNQVIHDDIDVEIKSSNVLDASIKLNTKKILTPGDNQGDVHYSDGKKSNKIQCKCKNGFSIDPTEPTKCICPAGRFLNNKECIPFTSCSTLNKVVLFTGSPTKDTKCGSCEKGYYDNSGVCTLTPCPAGSTGPPNCQLCPMGTYRTLDMNACAIPDPGYFAVSINPEKTGSVAQEMCSKGTADMRLTNYSPRLNRATYTAVGGVHVNDTVARSFVGKCSSCPQGDYQPLTGQSSCYKCNSGGWRAFSGCGEAKQDAADWCGGAANCATMINHHKCENVNNAVQLPASGATHCLYQHEKDVAGNNNFDDAAW